MKVDIDPRELASLILSNDILARPGLHSGDAGKAAAKFVASRDDVFVLCFCTLAMDQNVCRPRREWAAMAGVTFEQFKEFWRSLRSARLRGTDGTKRHLFRAESELLARLSKDDEIGGVGLHLSGKGAVPYHLNKRIAQTWNKSQRTINGTVAGAMERINADESVPLEERAAIETQAEEALGLAPSARTLPLFAITGTDGK